MSGDVLNSKAKKHTRKRFHSFLRVALSLPLALSLSLCLSPSGEFRIPIIKTYIALHLLGGVGGWWVGGGGEWLCMLVSFVFVWWLVSSNAYMGYYICIISLLYAKVQNVRIMCVFMLTSRVCDFSDPMAIWGEGWVEIYLCIIGFVSGGGRRRRNN